MNFEAEKAYFDNLDIVEKSKLYKQFTEEIVTNKPEFKERALQRKINRNKENDKAEDFEISLFFFEESISYFDLLCDSNSLEFIAEEEVIEALQERGNGQDHSLNSFEAYASLKRFKRSSEGLGNLFFKWLKEKRKEPKNIENIKYELPSGSACTKLSHLSNNIDITQVANDELVSKDVSHFWIKSGDFFTSMEIERIDSESLQQCYENFCQKANETKEIHFGIDSYKFTISFRYDFFFLNFEHLPADKETSEYWFSTGDLRISLKGKHMSTEKILHLLGFVKANVETTSVLRFGVDKVEFSQNSDFWSSPALECNVSSNNKDEFSNFVGVNEDNDSSEQIEAVEKVSNEEITDSHCQEPLQIFSNSSSFCDISLNSSSSTDISSNSSSSTDISSNSSSSTDISSNSSSSKDISSNSSYSTDISSNSSSSTNISSNSSCSTDISSNSSSFTDISSNSSCSTDISSNSSSSTDISSNTSSSSDISSNSCSYTDISSNSRSSTDVSSNSSYATAVSSNSSSPTDISSNSSSSIAVSSNSSSSTDITCDYLLDAVVTKVHNKIDSVKDQLDTLELTLCQIASGLVPENESNDRHNQEPLEISSNSSSSTDISCDYLLDAVVTKVPNKIDSVKDQLDTLELMLCQIASGLVPENQPNDRHYQKPLEISKNSDSSSHITSADALDAASTCHMIENRHEINSLKRKLKISREKENDHLKLMNELSNPLTICGLMIP